MRSSDGSSLVSGQRESRASSTSSKVSARRGASGASVIVAPVYFTGGQPPNRRLFTTYDADPSLVHGPYGADKRRLLTAFAPVNKRRVGLRARQQATGRRGRVPTAYNRFPRAGARGLGFRP